MREEEGAYLAHALPAFLVRMRQRRPDDASRRGFRLLGGTGDGGRERRVDVGVDQALPHRAVAGAPDDLDVALLQAAEGENRQRVLVQRRRADHETDPLAPELFYF